MELEKENYKKMEDIWEFIFYKSVICLLNRFIFFNFDILSVIKYVHKNDEVERKF